MEKRIHDFSGRIGTTVQLGAWDKIGIDSISVYKLVVSQLIQEAVVPLSSSLEYWDSKLNRGMSGVVIFGVQSIFRLREWRYVNIRQHMIKCRQKIYDQRNKAAEELGHLVRHMLKDEEKTEDIVKTSLNILLELRSDSTRKSQSDEITNVESAERALRDLQVQVSRSRFSAPYRETLNEYGIPSFVERYWPILLGGGFCTWKLLGSWRNIVDWFQDQILETVKSAWSNWIVDPLFRIYQTIRHDDKAQVAIMAKHSLESDLQALERMVIDFNQKYGDSTGNIEEIATKVRQGDISSVFLPYEKQMQSPLKSLIIGNLTQAVLIQVQKAKVDVDVAMSGIDKLLQSQQLVFGLVAALPGLGAIWWMAGRITAIIGGKSRHIRGRDQLTVKTRSVLGQIELILSRHALEEILAAQDLGLIIASSYSLRHWTKQILSSDELYNQFCSKLDRIENPESQIKDQLEALKWIYLCGFH